MNEYNYKLQIKSPDEIKLGKNAQPGPFSNCDLYYDSKSTQDNNNWIIETASVLLWIL